MRTWVWHFETSCWSPALEAPAGGQEIRFSGATLADANIILYVRLVVNTEFVLFTIWLKPPDGCSLCDIRAFFVRAFERLCL